MTEEVNLRRILVIRYFLIGVLLIPAGTASLLRGEVSDANQSRFSFSGEVSRYEDYQHELPGGLVFTLEFIGYGPEGWAIRIFDPAFPFDNFCSVVTPPYNGINALQIYSWHFLEGEGIGQGSVNAPGEERRFRFVTCKHDYDDAFASLSSMLWPESPEAKQAATVVHDGIPCENGVLRITELVPGGIGSDSARIDYIVFDVDLFIQENITDSCSTGETGI